jgi:cell division protein ZapA
MKTVRATVYGKEYTLACDEGQEAHLQKLVTQINGRCGTLEKAVGKLPESLMMLYVALMIADELHDSGRDNVRMKEELNRTHRLLHENSPDDARIAALEEEVTGNLQALAARIEGLAEKLTA